MLPFNVMLFRRRYNDFPSRLHYIARAAIYFRSKFRRSVDTH